MVEPKFVPYFTGNISQTKHGFKYCEISQDTPKKLLQEYNEYLEEKDRMCAEGEWVTD